MMKRILFLLCLLLPGLMIAQDKPLQLGVIGDITIDQQGAVHDYKIETALAPEVQRLVDTAVRKWRFEPIVRDGKPVNAKTQMSLLLTAMPTEGGYRLKIDRVQFGGRQSAATTMVPPQYPQDAKRLSVGAEVVVAMRIDQQGNVVDAVALRSRLLGFSGKERAAARMRERFERVSTEAAKAWKYKSADIANGEVVQTSIAVPFIFCVDRTCPASSGWRPAETADPQHPVPWLAADKQQFNVDGLRPGASLALDNDIKLQTTVVGTTL